MPRKTAKQFIEDIELGKEKYKQAREQWAEQKRKELGKDAPIELSYRERIDLQRKNRVYTERDDDAALALSSSVDRIIEKYRNGSEAERQYARQLAMFKPAIEHHHLCVTNNGPGYIAHFVNEWDTGDIQYKVSETDEGKWEYSGEQKDLKAVQALEEECRKKGMTEEEIQRETDLLAIDRFLDRMQNFSEFCNMPTPSGKSLRDEISEDIMAHKELQKTESNLPFEVLEKGTGIAFPGKKIVLDGAGEKKAEEKKAEPRLLDGDPEREKIKSEVESSYLVNIDSSSNKRLKETIAMNGMGIPLALGNIPTAIKNQGKQAFFKLMGLNANDKEAFQTTMRELNDFLSQDINGKSVLDLAIENGAVKPAYRHLVRAGMELAGIKLEQPRKEANAAAPKNPTAPRNPADDFEIIEKEPELGLGVDNARQYIEDLQRKMKSMPKARPNEQQIGLQEELALRIFTARIGIDAVSGSRGGKSLNVPRNYDREKDAAEAIGNNPAIQGWLNATPYDRLRKLILTGHGGEMEKDFRSYLVKQPEIPKGTPDRLMPTAKARCESLQAQIKAARKAGNTEANIDLQVQLCKELIATRNAVDAARGGEGLKARLTQGGLENERRRLEFDPRIEQAIRNAVTGTEPADRATRDLALSGHGGAFLDRIMELKSHVKVVEKPKEVQRENNAPQAGM